MKKGTLALIFCFWVVVVFGFMVSAKEGKIIYHINDPVGDELGPGTYTYPKHAHFEPFKGLFDLTAFTIVDNDQENYLFEFQFGKLTNPWHSRYGFSHPLIELYIDNKHGGSTNLFRPGAGVQLKKGAPWDVMVQITGWWIRAFRPEDGEKLHSPQVFWDDLTNPFDVKGANATVIENTIKVIIPKLAVGKLVQAKIFLLVGAFDSFGFDYFRDVKDTNTDWAFGGGTNPKYNSRVLDILVPSRISQKRILTVDQDADKFATIPYLTLGHNRILPVIAGGLIVPAGYLLIRKSKKKPISL